MSRAISLLIVVGRSASTIRQRGPRGAIRNSWSAAPDRHVAADKAAVEGADQLAVGSRDELEVGARTKLDRAPPARAGTPDVMSAGAKPSELSVSSSEAGPVRAMASSRGRSARPRLRRRRRGPAAAASTACGRHVPVCRCPARRKRVGGLPTARGRTRSAATSAELRERREVLAHRVRLQARERRPTRRRSVLPGTREGRSSSRSRVRGGCATGAGARVVTNFAP